MLDRRIIYPLGFALILAAATLWAVPHRPEIRPLPADWTGAQGAASQLAVFPNRALYDGDWLGVQVQANANPGTLRLDVGLDSPGGSPLIEGSIPQSALSDFWLAQWPWIWNSSGSPGWHTLFVRPSTVTGVEPAMEGLLPQYPVQVLPAGSRPELRQSAAWKEAESDCCRYYYLSGTESERDLPQLISLAQASYREISSRMTGSAPKLAVVFLPRLYGQGGVSDGEGVVSYLDRNPTGTEFSVVLTHEMVHLFSNAVFPPGRYPPAMLNEGWAVYITGGHYRAPESLEDRAAVVYSSGLYVPLATLADSFALAQHETAYIEAGAFVEFLVDRFGWDRVYGMFRDPARAQPPSAALDSMLTAHLQTNLAECESEWLATLPARTPDSNQIQDVKFTIAFFDDLRKYQNVYAPGDNISAMWIPDLPTARKRGMTADYFPSSESAEGIALETMFIAAQRLAGAHDWNGAHEILDAIEKVLGARLRRAPDPAFASPLAEDYRRLVSAVLRSGFEPLEIRLGNGRAELTVRPLGALEKGAQGWAKTGGTWSRVE